MAAYVREFMRLHKAIMLNAEEVGPEVSTDYTEFAASVREKLLSIAEYEEDRGDITDAQRRACANMIRGVRKWAEKMD